MTKKKEQIKALTLTTDFGLEDVYVGVMKGVIAGINPDLKVIDLTHQIPPQNIAAGRFCLLNAVPYFPKNTVHVAVVDPGVGSERKGCAIALENGFLVGPDNGLFSGILEQFPARKAVSLDNPKYWRTETVSSTFHGRDIFAPVGAHLANGVPFEEMGDAIAIEELTDFSFPSLSFTDNQIIGYIQYIDYFGNLITNIPASAVQQLSSGFVIPASALQRLSTNCQVALKWLQYSCKVFLQVLSSSSQVALISLQELSNNPHVTLKRLSSGFSVPASALQQLSSSSQKTLKRLQCNSLLFFLPFCHVLFRSCFTVCPLVTCSTPRM